MPNVRVHSAFEPLTVSRRTPVFVLTGAGISAESGVRTFRDAGGFWHSYRFEDVASPEAWAKDPALVWKFYSERRGQLTGIEPNSAHRALAELERQLDDAFFLCTQNVDPLHELAGSQRLLHMHGELVKSRCERGHAPPFDDRVPPRHGDRSRTRVVSRLSLSLTDEPRQAGNAPFTRRMSCSTCGRGRYPVLRMAQANGIRAATAIDIVEAAYRLDGSESEWLTALLEHAAKDLDTGSGAYAFTGNESAPDFATARRSPSMT